MQRGLFCAVEGIDGSGKSTLLAHLGAALADEGLAVHFGEQRFAGLTELREPTDGPTGRKLREHLRSGDQLAPDEWLKLFFEDREYSVRERIQPALARGQLVIQDRYFYSTAAYQGQPGSQHTAEQIVADSHAAGFPEPQVLLYLDLEPEMAMARITTRAQNTNAGPQTLESFENLAELQRIYQNYAGCLPAHTARLDAEQSPQTLCEIAIAHLQTAAARTE